nr:efflux RND transporter periplasmic adaptor subunit [Halomonas kenyensis]
MLTAALLAGCDAAPAETEHVEVVQPSVRSKAVQLVSDELRYRFPGVVRATERAVPAFLHGGVLRERHVVRGQRVEQGEPLATLHNPAMAPAFVAAEARVRELDASLSRLGRDVERARTLRERNLSAEEELDRLRSEREALVQAREQALAQRDETQAQLEELTLRAPFAAEVTDLDAEPGDFVAAGQPIMRLAGVAEREVAIRVPANLAARLELGQAASVSPTFDAQRLAGEIVHIGRAGESMAPIIISISNDGAPALGEAVRVQLEIVAREVTRVPLAAVVDPAGSAPYVLALNDDDTVRRVPVTPGRLAGGWVTVNGEGLAPGDGVVTAGQGRLEEGMRVRVLP